ncbi:MAG: hypothetical protein KAS32_19385 [Candidatus Peribacteraceae bacterium]|nr:hypothetical protein [Candidatus Peribacteraceae bacterium]
MEVEVCDNCIVISCMDMGYYQQHKKNRHRRIQCQECGAWWELASVKTIKYVWYKKSKYNPNIEPGWHRITWFYFHEVYVPMECSQRRCVDQAHHKVAKSGKRKYKCNKHAGVCIIA